MLADLRGSIDDLAAVEDQLSGIEKIAVNLVRRGLNFDANALLDSIPPPLPYSAAEEEVKIVAPKLPVLPDPTVVAVLKDELGILLSPKIEAIKRYRVQTGFGLKDAKEAVEFFIEVRDLFK